MPDLLTQLKAFRGRRLWLLGVGNPERGDDGFGVKLAEALRERLGGEDGPVRALDVGTSPERWVGRAVSQGCEELVLADAVDFGGSPGDLFLAQASELPARATGAATHRVPLSLLARYAEGLGARAWLLGVQPGSLDPGAALSPEVKGTLESLAGILGLALGLSEPGAGATPPAPMDGVAS